MLSHIGFNNSYTTHKKYCTYNCKHDTSVIKLETIFAYCFFYLVYRLIGLVDRVFANGPGDWGLIPGWVIPKTQKIVLDASLLNTQHHEVHIKCKVE